MIEIVLSDCGIGIGILLLVRKFVFWLDNVMSVGCVSMCVRLFVLRIDRLVNNLCDIELMMRLNVDEIGMFVLYVSELFGVLEIEVSFVGVNVLNEKLLFCLKKFRFVCFSIEWLNLMICMLICMMFLLEIVDVLSVVLFLLLIVFVVWIVC